MGKITVELIRRRAEHNEGEIQSLEEISLHQEKLEKIELLDRICRNLRILLLQNNSVSKIENVSRLKHLEYLNLALNMVEKIENLEGCESLKKLDLTLNFVGEITSVKSLRPNYYLEQLYLVGNPCHDFPGYRSYIITVLPQLKQLDGADITHSERLSARQNFDEVEATILLHQEAYLRDREQERMASAKESSVSTLVSSPRGKASSTKSVVRKKTHESRTVLDEEEDKGGDADDDGFWSQMTDNTPEARRAMNKRLEKQDAEKAAVKKSPLTKAKLPRRLEADDGRPLNVNEPKLSFVLHDEMERNQIVLDLAVPRFLCITLINADVQPTFVRVTVKGKIFQLVLPEEVKPDSSYAQRSQTTGHLIITMPKVYEHSTLVWRGSSGPLIELNNSGDKKGIMPSSVHKIPNESLSLGGARPPPPIKSRKSLAPNTVKPLQRSSYDPISVPVISPSSIAETKKKVKSGGKALPVKASKMRDPFLDSVWNMDDIPRLI